MILSISSDPTKQAESDNFYRDKSKFNANAYNDDLIEQLSNFFIHLLDITAHNFNQIFNDFITLISRTLDKHAPLKRLSRKQKKTANKTLDN